MAFLSSIPTGYIQLVAPFVVVLILFWFLGKYILQYRIPARRLYKLLQVLKTQVADTGKKSPSERRTGLNAVFKGTALEHAWQEFEETLHDQLEDVDGELKVRATRSTVPAAYFFATQNIVDTPLKTEYFKHLPGILTGIGIIGTFVGLLIGLYYFDPSNPEQVQASVQLLLSGVRDAFIASALAITVAMYVTNSEKKYLRICYEQVERLTEEIDKQFSAGVGEEYLAALVKAGEENSKETRLLKDSLVTDLRAMLQNLVDTQVRENQKLGEVLSNSYKDAGRDMAKEISASIVDSFHEPLNQIAQTVQVASGDQSGKVQTLLQDILVSFMNRLESTFGQQFNGLHEMMGQSISAMREMQSGFSSLIKDMHEGSESSAAAIQEQLSKTLQELHQSQTLIQQTLREMLSHLQSTVSSIGDESEKAGMKMAEQMEKLFAEGEARHRAMAEQLEAFIQSMKESVSQGQTDTMREIASSVGKLEQQLNDMFQGFEAKRREMDAASDKARETLYGETQSTLGALQAEVSALLASLSKERQGTEQIIQAIGNQAQRTIEGMQLGADKMRTAAERFEAAGNSVTETTKATGFAVQQIHASSNELAGASKEMNALINEYRMNRDATQKTLSILEGILANAQAEAGMRGQVIQDLKTVSDKLHSLNMEASSYLEKISGTLVTGFNTFDDGINRSLTKTLGSLDAELDKAIKALAGGVQDLSDNIEELSDTVERSVAVRTK